MPAALRRCFGGFASRSLPTEDSATADTRTKTRSRPLVRRASALVYPCAGARWRFDDGVSLDFLGPSLPFIARSRNDITENSIAFVLRYRSFCMLFTGDAGATAEKRFLSEGVSLQLRRPQSRASWVGLRFDAGIHRRGASAIRNHLRRAPQPLRPSCARDDRRPAALRRHDLPHR